LTEFGKAIGKGQGQEAGPTLHRQDPPRGGGGKSEASAFTSQSEILRIGALSFLWYSFRVKRIAFIFL
jgi:hypothetical protein